MADARSIPNPNPTPKQQLLSDKKRVTAHLDLMERPQFQDSINTALLQYSLSVNANVTDANSAAMAGMKLKGAQEFVDILFRLAFNPAEPTRPESQKLNHKA